MIRDVSLELHKRSKHLEESDEGQFDLGMWCLMCDLRTPWQNKTPRQGRKAARSSKEPRLDRGSRESNAGVQSI